MDIVSLHRQGLSIRAISARLGVSRNTVRAALRREGPPAAPGTHAAQQARPLQGLPAGAPGRVPRALGRRPARGDPRPGLRGRRSRSSRSSPSPTASAAASRWCASRRRPASRPRPTGAASAATCWATGSARPQLFVMVLGFSRALYAEAVWRADLESFLACHARAFAYFGGVPAEVLYDNAKVVVLERLADGPRYNPGLLDFAGRYGFAPRLCRPYRARTKGKVERSIGYLQGPLLRGPHASATSRT